MKLVTPSLVLSWLLLIGSATTYANSPVILTGYWQNFTNPAQTPVKLTDIPATYKIVDIAFGDMNSDGSVSFTLQGPPYDSIPNADKVFKDDIKTLQASGVKVILSLGGQNGYFSVNSTAAENNFINSLTQLITIYNFDGVDFDFESGLSTANVDLLVDATQKLKQNFLSKGKTLYFSNAPETIDVYWQVFPYGKYDKLIQANLLNTVQVQMYNSGCMPGINPGSACYSEGTEDFLVSQADSTIQTWKKNGITDAEQKYSIGLPATEQAAGGGYQDPVMLKKALICLQTLSQCDTYIPTQAYPQLHQVMTWSINWDAKNGYQFAKAIAPAIK